MADLAPEGGSPGSVDVESFLARPLVARVATPAPTLRPVWFTFEDDAFWWLTDTGTALAGSIRRGEDLVLVVDACDLATGEVICVRATGKAELLPLDRARAKRKFARYLGPDASKWDPRFEASLDAPTMRFAKLVPNRLTAADMSFKVVRPSRSLD